MRQHEKPAPRGRPPTRTNSWWDNPGRPTPYLLWGLIWCRCGAVMVPLDRPTATHTGSRSDGTDVAGQDAGTERFYRCDGGCGRPPVPAKRVEIQVLRAVAEAALTRWPRFTLRGVRTRRLVRRRADPDRRRHLIRCWVCRVVAGDEQPPQLHWQHHPA